MPQEKKRRPSGKPPGAGKLRRGRSQPSLFSERSDTKAVVDIGSNSIKLRVTRKYGDVLHTLTDRTEVVRLGKGLQSGTLSDEVLRHGVSVVRRMARIAGEMGARPRLAGTMALRVARNAAEFVRRVREKTGITVEILSGEEEARLAWKGAIYGLTDHSGDIAMFDTGGGSTEFIFGREGRLEKSVSIPVGAVRLTEDFFDADPVSRNGTERAQACVMAIIEAAFAKEALAPRDRAFRSVIGIGGGVAAMASVKLQLKAFDPVKINGLVLSRADVENQIRRYAACTLAERRTIPGLSPRRADIVLASACIVRCALRALGAESFCVSINGLRHGLIVEMFENSLSGKTIQSYSPKRRK